MGDETFRYKSPSAVLAAMTHRLEMRHASPRTIEAYLSWVRRFIRASGRKHPASLGESDVSAFLSHLATEKHVSASTQNQALAALLFLYKNVLDKPLDFMNGIVHAKRPQRLPVVLSPSEVARLLNELGDGPRLMASLLYGSGLRLMECLTLRVKDVDIERRQLTVRRAKGQKDRVALLPDSLRESLTPCATRLPHICSKPAPTFAPFRSSSGHADVRTTMIYAHVTERHPKPLGSPRANQVPPPIPHFSSPVSNFPSAGTQFPSRAPI